MKRPLAFVAFASVGFLVAATTVSPSGEFSDGTLPIDSLVDDSEAPPYPFFTPPAPPDHQQPLPDYGLEDPDFPLLPGDDEHASRSVGTVTDGYLFNARRVRLPHPHLEFLPRQLDRGLHYTGEPMLELIEDAALHVAEVAPQRRVHLGNLSRPGGGNIPYSVSHNSGRDADIAFFTLDKNEEPTRPPDLLPMNQNGVYDASEHDEADDPDLVLHFDTPLNWRLVEGLIESDAAAIKYIFVSRPLRAKLLEEAKRQNASAATQRIARQVLVQPGGTSLPHDDHFHVRIHCTDRDLASGCRERGRPGPDHNPDHTVIEQTADQAAELLEHQKPAVRRAAVRRLHLLEGHRYHHRIEATVGDPNPRVRIAAARALREHRPSVDTLTAQLNEEDHPAAFAELLDALAHHDTPEATTAIVDVLDRDLHIRLDPTSLLSATSLAANALARQKSPAAVAPLIEALETSSPRDRPQLVHALRVITNHRFVSGDRFEDEGFDELVTRWRDWHDEFGDVPRREWLIRGFQRAQLDVAELDEADVWELCRAISEDRHLSVNAQRVLERIAGESYGSVHWDPHDASFFWRRWFERREDRLDIPPTPEELSTADGYTEPS